MLFSVCSLRDNNVITSKPTWKQKHTKSILEYFEYFCQMTSKLICIILSCTISKFGAFSFWGTSSHYWSFTIQPQNTLNNCRVNKKKFTGVGTLSNFSFVQFGSTGWRKPNQFSENYIHLFGLLIMSYRFDNAVKMHNCQFPQASMKQWQLNNNAIMQRFTDLRTETKLNLIWKPSHHLVGFMFRLEKRITL